MIGTVSRSAMWQHVWLPLAAVLFCSLVLLNAGGYRYGVSDQAFYIPVVLHELDPALYPHDASLIGAQDRFFLFDDWFAFGLSVTGVSVANGFMAAYACTLALLFGAIVMIGKTLYATRWGVAGVVIGLTIRHRIPDTAVNSLEGYFHPRVLAFAVGLWAIAAVLRGRTTLALAATAAAFCVHPTTALWFAIVVGTAVVVTDRAARVWLSVAGAGVTAVIAWILRGPINETLVIMDPTWIEVLSIKDYLYPTEWPTLTWFGNLAVPAMIGGVFWYRRRLGLTSRREAGLVVGCAILLGLFLISVPFAAAKLALVVQLQVSRIFWVFDIIGTFYFCWLLIESPVRSRASAVWLRATPRPSVVAILLLLALTRGLFVSFVDPAGRPKLDGAETAAAWNTVMLWAAEQPVGTHFLAHPRHATRYGSSIRVAGRDVFLEVVKDTGIAIYSVDVAHRVARRLDDLGSFESLTEDHTLRLAERYELDFLITEQTLGLPEAQRAGHLHVYTLSEQPNAHDG